jgi:hypothetical protein
MSFTLHDLKKPSLISQFRFDPVKQAIAKQWNQLRQVDKAKYIVLDDPNSILHMFNEMKPLLLEGFQTDHPNEELTPQALRNWIGDVALAFGNTSDKLNRNIWLDLKECLLFLFDNFEIQKK